METGTRTSQLARHIAHTVTRNVLLVSVCLAAYLVGGVIFRDSLAMVSPDQGAAAVLAHDVQEDEAARLIERHDCWTGEAPADMEGEFPGRVVVTVHGATRLGGERAVGKALEQIFDGADHDLTIHGFCR